MADEQTASDVSLRARAGSSRRVRLGLALSLGLAVGCSVEVAGPPGHFVRTGLTLERAAELPLPESRLVRQLPIPSDLSVWKAGEGAEIAVRPTEDGSTEQQVLALPAAGSRVIMIQGAYDRLSFNRVAVHLESERPLELRAALVRGRRGKVDPGRGVRASASPGPQVVLLDLPAAELPEEPFDRLVIIARPAMGDWILAGIDLVQVPPGADMPTLEEGADLIDVEEDARRGVRLLTGHDLTADFEIPPAGVLTWSVAWPTLTPIGGRVLELEALVEPEGAGAITRRTVLGRDGSSPPRWETTRLDLARWAGRRAHVTFRLASSDGALAACALAETVVTSALETPPAVLLITSDTHRGDHMGAVPDSVGISTPALDVLGRRGVLFEDCLSSTNITNPSHVALMTATHPRDTGVLSNQTLVSDEALTLTELFRDAGYLTFGVVSSKHLGHPNSGLGQGFDRMAWPEPPLHRAEWSVERLRSWMKDAEDRPLFVWLHVVDAHTPYEPLAPYDQLYYPEDKDPADPALPDPEFSIPRNMPQDVRDAGWIEAQYRGEITYLDAQLQTIFELQRFRAGVVAFTSDHGECLQRNGIFWSHVGLYPDTIHVPLILAGPGVPAGARVVGPVFQLDLARTLLNLAELEVVPFPGRDLLDSLEPAGYPTEPRFALGAGGLHASITAGRWHLILALRSSGRDTWDKNDNGVFRRHSVELYDLEADPTCSQDLAIEQFDRARTLRQALVDWLASSKPLNWDASAQVDEVTLRQLAELGYVTADIEEEDGSVDYFDETCSCRHCDHFR